MRVNFFDELSANPAGHHPMPSCEDWTTVVLPLIAVVVLVVSFYIFLTPPKAGGTPVTS